MTLQLSQQQLTEIVDGHCSESAESPTFIGVEFDSRSISGGELFVALKGSRSHGHQFLDDIFTKGAALALVEDSALLQSSPHRARLVCVDDTLIAFGKVGAWCRDQISARVLGITGSVGKTTIKEMASAILLKHSHGFYSLRSYNNEIGLPYSFTSLSKEHNWVVQEMGMNAPQEMEYISKIARPDVAIIANIRFAHAEAFENIDGIADAKLEILAGVPESGTLIVPTDDEVLHRRLQEVDLSKRELIRFGPGSPDCSVSEITTRPDGRLSFTLHLFGEEIPITMNALGEHNALNGACAALAAKKLVPELTAEAIVDGLGAFRAPPMRLELRKLTGDRVIVDDSYNANPSSMVAAFEAARQLAGSPEKRIGVILGDMLELGPDAEGEHFAVGEQLLKIKPAFVVAVGQYADQLVASAKEAAVPYFTVESAVSAAHTARKLPFDLLLVKGSRGIRLDKTVSTLLELEGEAPVDEAAAFRSKGKK